MQQHLYPGEGLTNNLLCMVTHVVINHVILQDKSILYVHIMTPFPSRSK